MQEKYFLLQESWFRQNFNSTSIVSTRVKDIFYHNGICMWQCTSRYASQHLRVQSLYSFIEVDPPTPSMQTSTCVTTSKVVCNLLSHPHLDIHIEGESSTPLYRPILMMSRPVWGCYIVCIFAGSNCIIYLNLNFIEIIVYMPVYCCWWSYS
jgi:hypothetical protein